MKIIAATTAIALSAGAFWATGVLTPQDIFASQRATTYAQADAALAASASSTATKARTAGGSAGKPVVVELFTTQSCSSCPPADKVAAKLVGNPDIVFISRAVTYWDRLGWTDTLGREANTKLQRAYARRTLDGRNGVYTPQAVVNGRHGVVGSREADLRKLIASASSAGSPDLAVKPAANGGYTVSLSGKASGKARLSLVALDSHETVRVGGGENRGRTLTYTNILRDEAVIGEWGGGKASFTIRPDQMKVRGADRYAVLVQQGDAGPILAGSYVG